MLRDILICAGLVGAILFGTFIYSLTWAASKADNAMERCNAILRRDRDERDEKG